MKNQDAYAYTATNKAGVRKVCGSVELAVAHAGDDGFWICDRIARDPADATGTVVIPRGSVAGFSLIELMIAVTIVSVLGTVAAGAGQGVAYKVKRAEVPLMMANMLQGERALYAFDNGQEAFNGVSLGNSRGSENGQISNCYLPHMFYTPNKSRYYPLAAANDHCADLNIATDSPLYCAYGTWTSWNSALRGYTYLNTGFCDIDGDGTFYLRVQAVDGVEGQLVIRGQWEYDDVESWSHMRSLVLGIGATL
jgi:prepilin-type N-terminal cleavage/methylation domain-containing protein